MNRSTTITFLVVTLVALIGALAWVNLNPEFTRGPVALNNALLVHEPPPVQWPEPILEPVPTEPEAHPEVVLECEPEPEMQPEPPKLVPIEPGETPKETQNPLEGMTVKVVNKLSDKVLVGSGFLMQHRGRPVVLTSRLWFEGRVGRVSMRLPDGRDFFPREVHVDRQFDLAAMVIETAGIQMPGGSLGQNPAPGSMIYLGGFEGPASDDAFLVKGVRVTKYVPPKSLPVNSDWIVADAPVDRSMIGGPAFNANGEIVGLTVGIRTGDSRALVCCPGRITVFLDGMGEKE